MDQDLGGYRLCVHGSPVAVELSVPSLCQEFARLVLPMAVDTWPAGFAPISGDIRPFDYADVSRGIAPDARRVAGIDELTELYRRGECYWLLDDHWGMTHVNLLKNQWRSWILPAPAVSAARCFDSAVLWPMAQLLRRRGLEMLPAVSVEKNGFGTLILSPYGIAREISRLILAGYRVVGRRWTAMRVELDGLWLMQVPTDSTESTGTSIDRARCQAVVIIDAGRRSRTGWQDVEAEEAAALLRHAWPIIRLPANGRFSGVPLKLAGSCRCRRAQLSWNEDEFLKLMEDLRQAYRRRGTVAVEEPKPRMHVTLSVQSLSLAVLRRQAALAASVPAPVGGF